MNKKLFAILFYLCCLACTVNASQKLPVVVFDFGGVIAKADTAQMSEFLTASFAINKDELSNALRAMQIFVSNGGSEKEFWEQYAITKRVNLPNDWFDQYGTVIRRSITEIPETLALVKALQSHGYQTAILSDVTQYQAEILRNMGYYDLFSPVLLSCNTGLKKPDPKAFQNLLQNLNLLPCQILFIDDKSENVNSAKNLGIDAIHFLNPTQLKDELEKRGLVDNAEKDMEKTGAWTNHRQQR